jgi:MFS transporter, DHA1 family, inner membrane transport protein
VQFVNFMAMGFGFYMLHGGFQVFTSEIAPDARASAVSLQAFVFNSGQFAGPLVYGAGLVSVGKLPTLLAAAAVLVVVGLLCSQLLRHPEHVEETPDAGEASGQASAPSPAQVP